MTPEERAAAVFRACVCPEHIAAAIREAVDAETEACAAFIGKQGYFETAAAIRQRLKAAPDPYGADAPTMTPEAETAFRRRMNNADRDVD